MLKLELSPNLFNDKEAKKKMFEEFGLEQIEETKYKISKTNDYSMDQGEDLAFCDISAIDFHTMANKDKVSKPVDQSIMNHSELEIFGFLKGSGQPQPMP